ncbi:SDR family NAD(P)-dependent oxidoreductase [Fusibacter bizertensis]
MYHLITGGSSGLGFEIAKLLILMDEHVIILGRNVEKLENATNQLKAISKKADVLSYSLDISIEEDIESFIETLETSGKSIKQLYNVAGSTFFGKVGDIHRSDIDKVLNSNMIGLMLFTSKMLGYLQKEPFEDKRIISVLSTAALKGKKFETIYNAAKWGARGFLESLRDELSDSKIEVINVFPGGMKTDFWKDSTSGYDIDTFMDPADVARNIVKIAMDTKVYVTDITIGRPKS